MWSLGTWHFVSTNSPAASKASSATSFPGPSATRDLAPRSARASPCGTPVGATPRRSVSIFDAASRRAA
eukprot:scaffold95905_cov75-Phaeocystis_antarctica.AAC.2